MYPEPIRIENGISIYSKTQIDIFGLPPDNTKYIVVERSYEVDYVQSFQELAHCEMIKKHKYARFARFKRTLFNLLGDSNFKPKLYEVELTVLKTYLKRDIDKSLYDQAKDILKHFKQPQLYQHIPTILQYLGYTKSNKFPNRIIQEVLSDFEVLHKRFDRQGLGKRKYFPNLKFVAKKLLDKYNVEIPVNFIRTKRKLKALEESFNILVNPY